eukprot:gene6851-7572_t
MPGLVNDHENDDILPLIEVSSEKAKEDYPNEEEHEHDHTIPMTEEEKQWHSAAEKYIRNCHHFQLRVDPSVVIALRTGWDILQPTRHFDDGSMIALRGILEENQTIRKVNLANASMHDSRYALSGNGNSNARVLSHVLERNKWIEELDLSNNGLNDDGIREISAGLAKNDSIKQVSLARNHFGEIGATYLSQALQFNNTIKKIDLSRNALGFRSISMLRCVCEPKNIEIETNGNYVFEEILNSISHGLAFLGAVVGANVLISDTMEVYKTDYHFWAAVLYSFALMFLFLSSCLFHSFFMLPTTSRILQVLDHVGIYMVIAGSYTPFLLIGLHYHTSARVLLAAEWIAALLGSTFATCSDLNAPSTTMVELMFFLCMGMGIIMVWPLLAAEMSKEALLLALLGGAFYLVGIIFFILGEYKPIYHVIWHVFVVIAATIHWFDIYFYVVQVDLYPNSPTKAMVEDFVDSVSNAARVVDSMMTVASNMTTTAFQ